MPVRNLLAILTFALAAPALAKEPMRSPGVAIGTKAPTALPLKDSKGAPTTLAAQMGKKGLVLVLVRSADWCPYCKAQLIALSDIKADVTRRGYGLAALSYDAPEKLTGFAQSRGLTYTLLSDQQSRTIDALGLRDPQYKGMARIDGVPIATTLVLARDGAVKARHSSDNYRIRQGNAELLSMLDRVKP